MARILLLEAKRALAVFGVDTLKRLHLLITSAFVLSLGVCFYMALEAKTFPAAGALTRVNVLQRGGWHAAVNFTHNAYHLWRFDQLLVNITAIFSAAENHSVSLILFLSLAVFIEGLRWVFSNMLPERPVVFCYAGAAVAAFALLFLFGSDPVIICALAWYPWLFLVVFSCIRKGRLTGFLLFALIFICYRLITSANMLAFPLALTGVASAWLCAMRGGKGGELYLPRIVVAAAMFPIAYSILAAFFYPAPVLPDYPLQAQLINETAFRGYPLPLVGPAPSHQIIEGKTVDSIFGPFSLWLTLLCLLSAMFLWRHLAARRLLYLAFLLSLASALDTLAGDTISQIMPLASFTRLVPHLAYYPVVALVPAVVIITLDIAAVLAQGSFLWPIALTVLACVLPANSDWSTYGNSLAPGRLQRLSAGGEYHAFSLALAGLSKERAAELEKIIISPSYYIIRRNSLNIVSGPAPDPLAGIKVTSLPEAGASVLTSHNSTPDLIRHLHDGNPSTRWSPMLGKQAGDEWLHIRFLAPQKIAGLDLETGAFYTDFARALRISFASSCAESDSLSPRADTYSELMKIPEWRMPVNYTKSGFPYGNPKRDSRIPFPAPQLVQCLLIEQKGVSHNFDWSIAEVWVFTPPGT